MTSAILRKKFVRRFFVVISLIIVITLGPILIYNIKYIGKIYPNIYIAGINIGGKNPTEAVNLLSSKVSVPTKINLISQTKSFSLELKEIDVNYNFGASVERAYNITRTGNIIFDLSTRLKLVFGKSEIGLSTEINNNKVSDFVKKVDSEISVEPIYPNIQNINGAITVDNGTKGLEVDSILLLAQIGKNISYADGQDINIPMTTIDTTLSDNQILEAKNRGEKYLGKSITLNSDSQNFDYNTAKILNLINPTGGYRDQEINDLIDKIAVSINQDPQNPKFEFDGIKVTEFLPALNGIKLDNQKLKDLLVSKLEELAASPNKNIAFNVPVSITPPSVTTDQVNDLGIKELIGRGNSTYYHSIPGRVFNVNLAASRINGTLVKPGDTFSFNQTLGDVSKLTGYKEAYIISGGRTVLGDGGGVCQVSTTLFRAVLKAGLPIIERSAHAYRVGYYEQNSPPGLDATVYYPTTDFKFKNDTGSSILIEAKNNPKNYALSFDLYGTNDGRVATTSKPVVSNISPALTTVYQDDPSLPIGKLEQTDFAASGAKVSFNYLVTKNGDQIYKKAFVSNYQPWAAIYLRGTKI